MPRAPDVKNLSLGRGEIFFARYQSDGSLAEYHHLGNCSALETSFADEEERVKNFMSSTGGDYRVISTGREGTLSITMMELNKENLALITSGRVGEFTQTSGSVTGEQISADGSVLDAWFDLDAVDISNVTVDQGATPLVEGTDYEVDAELGMILLISGGAIVDGGDPITVDYDKGDVTRDQVSIGSDHIEGHLRFKGNPVVGPVMNVDLWKVKLSPEGTLALINESPAEPQLTGAIQEDAENHPEPNQYGRAVYTGEFR